MSQAIKKTLTAEELDALDAEIPARAQKAFSDAYKNALATHGKVWEAKDDLLVETRTDGSQRVIRKLPRRVKIKPGAKFEIKATSKPKP